MIGDIPFNSNTLVMGVINVTPDSFYEKSRVVDTKKAIDLALRFIDEGADIIDVGGESSRPGALPISAKEECDRVLTVIKGIRKNSEIPVSIDTYKEEVAQRAIGEGATMINDITGLRFGDGLAKLAAKNDVYLIIMHMRGRPKNMMHRASYTDVVREVSNELLGSIQKAQNAGVDARRIIIDPGIGFAKAPFHNLLLIKHLDSLKEMGFPVLIGLSRKSFLGVYTKLSPEQRLAPTVAANAVSILQGADIIRVHDVKEGRATADIIDAIKGI